MTGRELSRWADSAMYRSETMPKDEGGKVVPTVKLIAATPDPLGVLAQLAGIYKGRVVRSLAELSDADRRAALEQFLKTKLQGPLESIQFQFLIEGVTRSWTHQAVRGRHAFYAQESLRFAVIDEEPWLERVAYPPSLAREPKMTDQYWPGVDETVQVPTPDDEEYAADRAVWDNAIDHVYEAYQYLVDKGYPAEDMRGLMPHAMTTRLVWVCSLRELLYVAGVRLCTQAQFEWRQVMAPVVKALREFSSDINSVDPRTDHRDAWQFALMADYLRPICYQEGKCGFMAEFDRGCRIRERVEANARLGRPSSEWHREYVGEWLGQDYQRVQAIDPHEWAADPEAAR